MKKLVVVALALIVVLAGGTAFAAGNKVQQGTSEFAVFMSIDNSESSASTSSSSKSIDQSTSMNLSYGYFLTDGLQLGFSYMGMASKSWQETNGKKVVGSDSESTFTFLYLDLKYNFVFDKAQTVVPYLGVGLGTASTTNVSGATKTTGSGFATALMGGVKFFVTENTSFNAELRMDSFTYTPSPQVGTKVEYTTDTVGLNLGLSVYF